MRRTGTRVWLAAGVAAMSLWPGVAVAASSVTGTVTFTGTAPKPGPLQANVAIPSDRRVDGLHQLGFAERFGEEVHGAALDGAYRRWNVAVSGDEDDRRMLIVAGLFLEFQPVDVREFDIEDQATGQVRPGKL